MIKVEIDLNALKANLRYIKAKAGVPVLAVVKADAYGHGLVRCAQAAVDAGADYLGTATRGRRPGARRRSRTDRCRSCRMARRASSTPSGRLRRAGRRTRRRCMRGRTSPRSSAATTVASRGMR